MAVRGTGDRDDPIKQREANEREGIKGRPSPEEDKARQAKWSAVSKKKEGKGASKDENEGKPPSPYDLASGKKTTTSWQASLREEMGEMAEQTLQNAIEREVSKQMTKREDTAEQGTSHQTSGKGTQQQGKAGPFAGREQGVGVSKEGFGKAGEGALGKTGEGALGKTGKGSVGRGVAAGHAASPTTPGRAQEQAAQSHPEAEQGLPTSSVGGKSVAGKGVARSDEEEARGQVSSRGKEGVVAPEGQKGLAALNAAATSKVEGVEKAGRPQGMIEGAAAGARAAAAGGKKGDIASKNRFEEFKNVLNRYAKSWTVSLNKGREKITINLKNEPLSKENPFSNGKMTMTKQEDGTLMAKFDCESPQKEAQAIAMLQQYQGQLRQLNITRAQVGNIHIELKQLEPVQHTDVEAQPEKEGEEGEEGEGGEGDQGQ
ncbi:hypothetical protein JYU14_02880 [Simkania negevensis]|uniref:Flagellar hook-length control protein-like C-terminal domain-containing protein n=1 Tax=Simkania negevensis TaxID=83561 RepID=A0ABS3AQJ7_9BACT|nr:hypothetical protein [Simkania negevensis]